jgi:dihydroflavonol-4-reductase
MRIFVTGATGFIGSHLVRLLIQERHTVRCLVRATSDTHRLDVTGVELVYGDTAARETLIAGMRGCDWVLDLAGIYSVWERDARVFQLSNVIGTRNVMECALLANVSKVVHVSSVAVYGQPAERPFREESQPGIPLSAYGRSKAAGDRIAWELYSKRDLPLVMLYPGIVLGAGDSKASGQYIRDFVRGRTPSTLYQASPAVYVYVRDVAKAILNAAEKPDNFGERYLIGKWRLTGMEYARLISRLSGRRLPPFNFPDWLVSGAARMLTSWAGLSGMRPWWGLSLDAARMLRAGFDFDGSKAERELGIHYMPIEIALAEEIAGLCSRSGRVETRPVY